MTMPTITYGHGYLEDGVSLTNWTEAALPELTVTDTETNNDVLVFTCVTDDIALDEYSIFTDDVAISTTTYPYYYVRYKTSSASNGVGLQVYATDSTVTDHYLVGDADTRAFSTAWTVASGALPTGLTLDALRIKLDDDPNSIANGTYYVYIDFILFCKGVFVFPNVAYGSSFTCPPRNVRIPASGRVTDWTQNLGAPCSTFTASCDLDVGTWTRVGDTRDGDVFRDISHNSYREPWQWLNTGEDQVKATLDTLTFRNESSGDSARRSVDVTFTEKRRSSGATESWYERFGTRL